MNRYAKKITLKPEAEAFILPWTPPGFGPAAQMEAHPDIGTALDAAALYGNAHPLEIEVGFGTGKFITEYAQVNPESNLLGIEVTRKMVWCAANKTLALSLKNIRLVHGDARDFLKEKIKGGTIHKVHLYFPDPWPKKRHRKRRVVNQKFLETAFFILKPGGTFHFATDHAEYFEYFNEEIRTFGRFLDAPADLAPLPTSYELKWRKLGRQIYRAALKSTP